MVPCSWRSVQICFDLFLVNIGISKKKRILNKSCKMFTGHAAVNSLKTDLWKLSLILLTAVRA